MYKLKYGVSYSNFMASIERCSGDVIFQTTAGDILNLKSKLSQFIFASAVTRPELIEDGQIICCVESDIAHLAPHLTYMEE